MNCPKITLLICYVASVGALRYEGSTDCDLVRSSYVQLEKGHWDKYVDKESSLSRNERLYKIINQHFMFVQQYMQSAFSDQDFDVLQRFYEWNVIEPDIKSVHSLFKDHFVGRLEKELDEYTSKGSFDERAFLDLAETVLQDPLWRINQTLDKIQNNIYNQGLYYKAKSVRLIIRKFNS